MKRFITTLLLTLLACAFLAPSFADAQRRRRGRGRQEPRTMEQIAEAPDVADIDQIAPQLESDNPDEVRAAIDLLGAINSPAVIPHLSACLRRGQPDVITDRILIVMGGLAHPSAISVLVEFTHHRRVGARRRAYMALSAIQDPRVPRLLEQGLRDSDRTVRAAAATNLGTIGATGSIETLFFAFERGVIEAAASIGKLGDPSTVARFSEHLGNVPLSVMLSGYNRYLEREDIPERTKIDIINRLGEVAGPMVRRFLSRYLDTFSARDRSRLRTIVRDTLRRIPGPGNRGGAEAAPPAEGGKRSGAELLKGGQA